MRNLWLALDTTERPVIARRRPWTIPAPLVPKFTGAMLEHKGPARSLRHLSKVRQQGCLACPKGTQTTPTEAHHCRHLTARTMGVRKSDFTAVPLCRWHHQDGPTALHKGNESTWWDEHRIDPRDFIRSFSAEGRDALRETET